MEAVSKHRVIHALMYGIHPGIFPIALQINSDMDEGQMDSPRTDS